MYFRRNVNTQVLSYAGVALVLAVLGGSWAFDAIGAGGVVMSTTVNPPRVVADGVSKTVLTIQVRGPSGAPRQGDTVEAINLGPGLLDRSRALTDAKGEARFEFVAARSSKYRPAKPVPVQFSNVSLGKLIEVQKSVVTTVDVVAPGGRP